ncbi:hypothetical protein [Hymenobacter sp. BT730]|uniref:hypothetical protein n=1 Tax=Hymenobacter sp. BT730 TaxID=3063332 RepID=UPI0026DF1113|nr:hypothetical protein [Hymenobacter sp. BT730]
MPSSAPAFLAIEYRADLQILIGRWMRSVMPFELHQGYGKLLDEAVTYKCRYWLVDIRRRSFVDGNDVAWMMETFYPQVQPRLGRTTYLAYLMAPHQLAGVLTDSSIPDLSVLEGRPYQLQRFTDEAAALEWLQQCYEHDTVTS